MYYRRARSYRHLGPAPGATVVPKAATGRLDETHARACLAMTGFAVLLHCPTRLNASVVAIDAPDALTITQGETMVQSGWGRGDNIRLLDGGRSDVHILLPHVAHNRWENAAWRGIGVDSRSVTTNTTSGITPIFTFNMLKCLSRLV